MRRVIFSIATNGYDLKYADCIQSHREYAERFGFDYFLLSGSWGLDANESAWLKVPVVLGMFKRGVDQVFFLDADCIVRQLCPNFSCALEDIAVADSICMARGWSGRINSGVFVATSGSSLVRQLEEILEQASEPDIIEEQNKAPFENGHFIQWFGDSPVFRELDGRWNSIKEHCDRDFIWHFTGPSSRQGGDVKPQRMQLAHKVRNFVIKKFFVSSATLQKKVVRVADKFLELNQI